MESVATADEQTQFNQILRRHVQLLTMFLTLEAIYCIGE